VVLTLDRPEEGSVPDEPTSPERTTASVAAPSLTIAAIASIGAGVIHAAAIAGHSDHRQAVWAFLGIAVVQLAWGAAALARPTRWLAIVGAALGVAAIGGFALAKSRGISFVDGLDEKEPVQFADGLAAAFAAVTFVGCALAVVARRLVMPPAFVGAIGMSLLAVTVPGTTDAVDHSHAGGDDHAAAAPHGHDDGTTEVATGGDAHTGPAAVVPPRPYDPELPIDLGGVEGVTPAQQARAENLLASTVLLLPQWSDPEYALANGFFSIGDGALGTEHFLNRAFMEDDVMLDPTKPESLVWDIDRATGERTLSAAMFMATPGTTLDAVPDVGGPLTQWHVHDNLCFNAEGQVRGLTNADGSCTPPLVKGAEIPMIHVWIRPHECGPFAALEGIAGGTVPEGEPVLCDHAHG
jgi:hypothetical protein